MALRGRTAVLSHAMEGVDRRTRRAPLVAIAAYAASVAAACELAFILAAAGSEARSVVVAACAAAALEIAAAVAVGGAAALALREPGVAAFGIPFAALDLFALANGGFPGVEARAIPAWLAAGVAVAALALGAIVGRFIRPRRAQLAAGADPAIGRAVLAAPPLVAGVGFGAMLAALRFGASPGGRGVWAAGAAGALAAPAARTTNGNAASARERPRAPSRRSFPPATAAIPPRAIPIDASSVAAMPAARAT